VFGQPRHGRDRLVARTVKTGLTDLQNVLAFLAKA
jgi:hypothetical protein